MNLEWLPLPPLALMTLVFPGLILIVVCFLDGTFGKRKAPRETLRRIPQPRRYVDGVLQREDVPMDAKPGQRTEYPFGENLAYGMKEDRIEHARAG